ncbi:MAG: sialate O-acetylesterase [Planctomycetaceae bacterium]|nr:sialate O-acetylesterase [Planctomycetaceae bacterium]
MRNLLRRTFYLTMVSSVSLLNASSVQADEAGVPTSPESFHLYLLIGQSNMAGRGVVEDQDRVPHPRVLMFTKDEQWAPATDPIHFDKTIAGVGLGSTFGRVMADADPSITVGLIPCAVGGTPLSRWQKDGDLYQQAVVRAKAAMQKGTLKGILWHQGESESGSAERSGNYCERLSGMVTDLRTELQSPDVPFVAGELGRFLAKVKNDKPSYWPVVNEQLHLLPMRISKSSIVSSEGLSHKGDDVHFDSPSLREFGRRYAKAMQKLQTP